MAFETFNPPVSPSPGASHDYAPAVNRAEFGDGYTQSSPRGLNHVKLKIKFTWDGVVDQDMQTIIGFFDARGGTEPFWYQPHGYTAARKWTCAKWSVTDGPPWRITADFEESFIPEP